MKIIIPILFFCLAGILSGCTGRFALWCAQRSYDKKIRIYGKALAKHAQKEELIGTWEKSKPVFLKKIGPPGSLQETLSLFSDGSYAKKIKQSSSSFIPHLSVEFGKWEKIEPGKIKLTKQKSESFEIVDFTSWTNVFSKAEKKLVESDKIENSSN